MFFTGLPDRLVKYFTAPLSNLKEVSTLFVRNKIQFMLVKGYAIAKFYPDYSRRSYMDIDFIIPSSRMVEKASKLLLEAGYNLFSASQPQGLSK